MNIVSLLVTIMIIAVVLYAGTLLFKEMVATLWNLSPLTSIGFIASVGVAIWKGKLRLSRGVDNLRILVFIFGGTVIAYAATTLIPNIKQSLFGGDWISVINHGLCYSHNMVQRSRSEELGTERA